MQDTRTGNLVPLDDLSQEAKDKAIPREFQGSIFAVGDIVEIRGGKFKIIGFRSRGRMILKGCL